MQLANLFSNNLVSASQILCGLTKLVWVFLGELGEGQEGGLQLTGQLCLLRLKCLKVNYEVLRGLCGGGRWVVCVCVWEVGGGVSICVWEVSGVCVCVWEVGREGVIGTKGVCEGEVDECHVIVKYTCILDLHSGWEIFHLQSNYSNKLNNFILASEFYEVH